MDGERLTELIMLVFMMLLMVAMAWMMKAAATGQIKRNPRIQLRTPALTHCDSCWLLGHHAASNKSLMGLGLAVLVMAAGGVAIALVEPSESLFPATLMLATLLMLAGILLGLRDANRAVAKIHAGEGVFSS